LPQLLLLLLTVVFAAKAVGALTARSLHPAVFGEILIGLLAGPPSI
jgi:Kef-type K+ transport system membrane component KefB